MTGAETRYPRPGRFAVRFADGQMEWAYRRYFLAQDKRYVVLAIALYTVLKASFAVIDVIVQPPAEIGSMLLLRFAFVFVSLLVMLIVGRVRTPGQYDAWVFGWALLAVASTFYTISHRPSDHFGFVSTSPMLVVLFFAFFRNRFELQLLSGCMLVAADMFAVFLLRDPQPAAGLIQICVTYAVSLIVGIAVSRQLKQSRRSYFATLQQERELAESMRELAFRDELTSVLNRRSFLQQASERWRRPIPGVCDCVLILDLDHFKLLNDRYGHDVGDEALVRFARMVEAIKRNGDVFGRIGGEEFALWLSDTGSVQAEAIAEEIMVECRLLPMGPAGAEPLSVSVGIAEVTMADQNLAETMRRADRALYHAKALGRGRSCTARDVAHSK